MNHEKALLSQILQDNDIFYRIQPKVWWFTSQENRRVFTAICDTLEKSSTADVISVGMAAGPSLVAGLSDYVPTTANAEYYAKECKRTGGLDELRKLSFQMADGLKTGDLDKVVKDIDTTIERILMDGGDYSIMRLGDKLMQTIETLEERYKARGTLPGIPTGFGTIDSIISGLQSERLYVIGARPSQGKSALMLNMASIISRTRSVGVLSLESSWQEIVLRELSNISNINSQKLAGGFFSAADFSRLTDAAGEIDKKQIYLYDKPNCSLTEIVGQCRRMVTRHNVEVIFIDYLQLIQAPAESDRERVVKASNRVKDLSRELHVPIVVLAQLRRDSEGRRPGLGDFQHSSQIEQDADVAMLLYHRVSDLNNKNLHKVKVEDPDNERLDIFLLVDKNRDGRTGAVPLDFQAETVRFVEKKS